MNISRELRCARAHPFWRFNQIKLVHVTTTAAGHNHRPPPTDPAMRGPRRFKGALCRWEKNEILALGPKTSPWRGPMVFSAGGARI